MIRYVIVFGLLVLAIGIIAERDVIRHKICLDELDVYGHPAATGNVVVVFEEGVGEQEADRMVGDIGYELEYEGQWNPLWENIAIVRTTPGKEGELICGLKYDKGVRMVQAVE